MRILHKLMASVVAVGSFTVVLGLSPSAASAELRWLGRETDTVDEPNCDPSSAPCLGWDIRTVTVKIRDADNGRAYLTITLRSYTAQGGFASGVALDTRGGPRADYRGYLDQARLAEETIGGPGRARCGFRAARPDSHIRLGAFRHFNEGSVATCRVPLQVGQTNEVDQVARLDRGPLPAAGPDAR